MLDWAAYKPEAANWITFFESRLYPDYLEDAITLYGPAIARFGELVDTAQSSEQLLIAIAKEARQVRGQLLRVFRRYVCADLPVEMTKATSKISGRILAFGNRFRPIEVVRERFHSRPIPDEAIIAVFWEHKDRGKKGYELTGSFFAWFEEKFGREYVL